MQCDFVFAYLRLSRDDKEKMEESNSRKKSCTLLILITLHLPFLEKHEITILFPLFRHVRFLNRLHHL